MIDVGLYQSVNFTVVMAWSTLEAENRLIALPPLGDLLRLMEHIENDAVLLLSISNTIDLSCMEMYYGMYEGKQILYSNTPRYTILCVM